MKYILIILLILSSSLIAQGGYSDPKDIRNAIEMEIRDFPARNVARCYLGYYKSSSDNYKSTKTVYVIGANKHKQHRGQIIKFWTNFDGSAINLHFCGVINGEAYYAMSRTTKIKFQSLSYRQQLDYLNKQ